MVQFYNCLFNKYLLMCTMYKELNIAKKVTIGFT